MKIDLDDEFEAYMRKVNPSVEAHSAQYKESRRVWFAASACVYFHMTGEITNLSEDEAIARLKLIEEQLIEFATRVGEERD